MKRFLLTAALAALASSLGCLPSQKQVSGSPDDPAAQVGQFFSPKQWEYVESPNLNMIPPEPVRGMADGRPFEIKSVIFQPFFDSWSMQLGDTAPASPLDISFAREYIKIDLPRDLKAGSIFFHPLEWAGGQSMFQIAQKESEETTSWNSNAAWAIEITQWEVKPYDQDGDLFQEAGTASGRVYICYQGSAGFLNSGVAGYFRNAVVRYMGDPGWGD